MKRSSIYILSFAVLVLFAFGSCKKDEFLDWKFLNKQWLIEHKEDPGFISLESGVQYKVINPGWGEKPIKSDKYIVEIKCKGWYITGEKDVFQPDAIMSSQVGSYMKGFQEVLREMKEDATYEMRIPQELGYGDKKDRGIPPYSTLIFRVTLKGVRTD